MIIELRAGAVHVKIAPLGGRLVSCEVDGREYVYGSGTDDDPGGADLYAGVLCGRHAGRITKSTFPLDGADVRLSANQGPNHLHGGHKGFGEKLWSHQHNGTRLEMSLNSPDGEEGFPGELAVKAVYEVTPTQLSLEFSATTTKPTLCNLTNHAYWNLAASDCVLDHELQIFGANYFPLDEALLPLGKIAPVADTRFDFRKRRAIAEDYDNCFLLDGEHGTLKRAMTLRDPQSQRTLDVWTTERCLQMYTAWHWDPSIVTRTGPIKRSQAFAIEPQNVADAPNHPNFPSSILRPGDVYRNRMEWRFS